MKIDQILIYYLLKNKELALQGIGVFRLEGAVTEPAEKGKPLIIPSDAITFEYNPKVKEDDSLVTYISETTGKIHPLASADLDSYLMLSRQFLNIGEPMIIPNIGTVEKVKSGVLIFKGGEYAMERIVPNDIKKPAEEAVPTGEPESFSDFPVREKNKGRTVSYLILVVILALIVWAVWKYSFNHANEETVTHTDINPVTDTSRRIDTIQLPTQQTQAFDSSKAADTTGFKVVVGTYRTLERAQRRLDQLKLNGRNVIMFTNDSINYKIAEPFNLPLSDTSKIMNAIRIYYGKERKYSFE
ncbi:MAG: hypothetical protein J0H55_12405 [Chitinophagaceae bacterium]|nr:hypothetical protein [Chitinophagaceae bacterium]